ncbi:MAG: DUF1428 domain-containing protein [Paracoccaceae bacterium]
MAYVEIFLAPVPSDKRALYQETAAKMAAHHKACGALEVTECWGTDVPDGKLTSFPMAVKAEAGETVVAGWIRWPSKEVRDLAMEKTMSDPAIHALFDDMPIDGKRLIHAGFDTLLEA